MAQSVNNIIDEANEVLVNTYELKNVVMDHAKGVYIYDTEGNEYLDFAGGIAVASLGHSHPKVLETLNKQASKLITCHNYFLTTEKFEAAKMLVEASCFDQVFFSNSGTESVESALKCARKWAYDTKGKDCSQIISFRKSFHGRTYGAASVTEKRLAQPFFDPYLPNVDFAEFNNIDSVKELISNQTAAVIIEPIQGESGVTPANSTFMKELRTLCNQHKVCLIFDEVQTGLGRLGTLFAYEKIGVEPDLVAWAKGIGAGFPVGVMAAKKPFSDAIVPGMHGSTFGGNPLACALVMCAFEEISKDDFMENINEVSKVLFNGFKAIAEKTGKITDIRGAGLMIGIDTVFDIKTLLSALQNNGLLGTQAGTKTLRLVPPLVFRRSDALKGLEIVEKTLNEMEQNND